MDEPLLEVNKNGPKNNEMKDMHEEKTKGLMSLVKRVIKDVNKDMDALDYTINTLLFGHQFDLLFLEHDHTRTLEWQKFTSSNSASSKMGVVPVGMQEALLKNDQRIAAVYGEARARGIGEETFWTKWHFYRFLKDQQQQKQQQQQKAQQPEQTKSNTTLLLNKEELEGWD